MGFFDTLKDIGLGLAGEAIKDTSEKIDKYNKYAEWSSSQSNEDLIKCFKTSSNYEKKLAISAELKKRNR